MQRVNKAAAIAFKARLMTLRGHSASCAVVVTDNTVTVNGVTVLKPIPNPKVDEMLVNEAAFRVMAEWNGGLPTQQRRDNATRSLAYYVK